MSLQWNDSLLLGNAEIDAQHRQIFCQFEKLCQACLEGRGEEVQKGLLNYLDEYATRHFADEEAFMAKNSYPKLVEQQVQHTYFRQMVKDLQEMDIQSMDAQQLSLLIYQRLVSWFNIHIKGLDQEMINYIVSRQHY